MPGQLTLFGGDEPRVLVDDATGRIVYYQKLMQPADASALFDWAVACVAWSTETMWMYDRMVAVPRLVARYDVEELPPPLAGLLELVERTLGTQFTALGLNYYRDGRDSVAWHSDHLSEMPPQPTIALVSLGATRTMGLRTKRRPRVVHWIDLEAGSLLAMSGRSQECWEHTIPKSWVPCDARVSLAFRPRSRLGTDGAMESKPQYERPVESDRPYEEDASVPGDNDPKTALDPEKEMKAKCATRR